jgi:hypothetical protein
MREEDQCIMHDADHKGIVADQACMASHLFHSCGDTKISDYQQRMTTNCMHGLMMDIYIYII